MKLTVAVQEFLTAQEADGSSGQTVAWYRSLLKKFVGFTGDVEIETISTSQIRQYIIEVRRQYAPDTAHGHVRSQHKFWRWCSIEYDLKNPMRNIKYPAQPKQKEPKAAAVNDLVAMFRAIDTSTHIGRRDRAILAFLVDTGSRSAGVYTLKVANLDLVNRRAVVTEKGNKSRQVMFTEVTAACLASWMEIRSPVEHVFYSMTKIKPLTRSGVYQIMKRLKKNAGVLGRANPHALRHAFSLEYLKAGGDLATLSRLLGHSDIATTAAYYAVFAQNELAELHDQFSQAHFLEDVDKGELGV